MAGRGHFDEVEKIRNPQIKVLRNGRWQGLFLPVNPDRKFSGVNLAESFADAYAREHGVEVGLTDVPFLVGGLGDFLKDCPLDPALKNYHHINASLQKIASQRERVGFVSAEGLGANGDNLHFNAKALREFGLRYYEEFKKSEDKNKVFSEKSDMDGAIRTQMEAL